MIPQQSLSSSAVFLIVANVTPLAGVLFWDWTVYDIMAVFWLENIIIGLVHVLKMATAMVLRREYAQKKFIFIFILHYGLFTLGQGAIVTALFADPSRAAQGSGILNLLPGAPGDPLWLIGAPFLAFIALQPAVQDDMLWTAGALLISHLFSFGANFIRHYEYKKDEVRHMMGEPYIRVVILYVALLLGGVLIPGSAVALIALVGMKTAIDLALHLYVHGKASELKEAA